MAGMQQRFHRTYKMLKTLSVTKPWKKHKSVRGFLNLKNREMPVGLWSRSLLIHLIWILVILLVLKN